MLTDDYASKATVLDVWSRIATTYGENWTSMGTHLLPDHREGRGGHRHHRLRAGPGHERACRPPGVHPDKDVSVPINWAYNHHYMTWMLGEHSYAEVAAQPATRRAPTVDRRGPSAALRSDPDAPTSLLFSEATEANRAVVPWVPEQTRAAARVAHLVAPHPDADRHRRDCGVTRDVWTSASTLSRGWS